MILQQGAGRLYISNERAPEPEDLTSAWPDVWEYLGNTKGGVEFSADAGLGVQYVMESYSPIGTEQGDTETTVSFGMASVTANNLALALGGEVRRVNETSGRFMPTSASGFFALGWESNEGTERWIYRRCRATGGLSVARAKSEQAVVPTTFTLFGDYSGRELWVAYSAD